MLSLNVYDVEMTPIPYQEWDCNASIIPLLSGLHGVLSEEPGREEWWIRTCSITPSWSDRWYVCTHIPCT